MSFLQKGVVKGTMSGLVNWRNIFFADVQPSSGTTYQDLWSDYLDSFYTPVLTFLTGEWTSSDLEIYEKSGGEWVLMDTIALVKTGTGNTAVLPNYAAGVLLGKVVGNRAFGRKFIGGLLTSSTNANTLGTSALEAFVTVAANYISPIINQDGSTFQPGIVTKDGAFRAFSQGLVSSLLGTMRRRKPGLGI